MPADPSDTLVFIRDELRSEFLSELKSARLSGAEIHPQVFLVAGRHQFFWVLDLWWVSHLSFNSISDATRQLKRLSRAWQYVGGNNFRRGQLIADSLKAKNPAQVDFFQHRSMDAGWAFTLLNDKEILYTAKPLKLGFAGGKITFAEDRIGPPSRAYLKLWEILALTGRRLTAQDKVLDLGATPGGWSYVAASLGAEVTMIDRAKPADSLFVKFLNLKFLIGNGLNPAQELLDWATVIVSDMACEPAKLLPALKAWLNSKRVKFIVATLKFHGSSDLALIREFAVIPGVTIYHLWHNGHELTLVWSDTAQ